MSRVVLQAVIEANLAAAAAILLVILSRHAVRSQFGPGAAYALWSAPLLAAAATFAPQADIDPSSVVVLRRVAGLTAHASGPALASLASPLLLAWATGVSASLLLILLAQRRFTLALGPLQAFPEYKVLRGAHPQAGPAVIGALRPRIVVPSDFEANYDTEERELILAHERAHLARKDSLANAAAALFLCFAWFNPLVHLAVRLMRIDQEMACDAHVIAGLACSRRRYAELLLRSQLAGDPLPLGCGWPATGVGPLRARISMLAQGGPSPTRRRLGGLLAATLVAGAGGAAWAMQGATSSQDMVLEPAWTARPTGQDLAAVYPPAAGASGIGGGALLECIVGRDGRLETCTVLRAVAADGHQAGFADAAMRLAPTFRMAALDRNGSPTAGERIRIPFLFVAPKAAASEASR